MVVCRRTPKLQGDAICAGTNPRRAHFRCSPQCSPALPMPKFAPRLVPSYILATQPGYTSAVAGCSESRWLIVTAWALMNKTTSAVQGEHGGYLRHHRLQAGKGGCHE